MKIRLEDDSLKLRSVRGASIAALAGVVWVTETDVIDDTFLGPGQRYSVKGDGLVLVMPEPDLAGARTAEITVDMRRA